ncbi:type II toxin-antitoxin system RelE/ParE family toxin [uncultured Alsobacter sp.]|uniref:type II toxin-antitoxin system RelE/ParE family toxin n=1 Tax=uncultured Alsobacter sp. TaxID=1748258 RepID=UPI0025F04DF0|nr:type II toxin-antitoxin system RelE/ParE family toxin [uncultured Alsobacter sp.]
MVKHVVLRPAAQRDLDALYAYIRDARGDPAVAIGYLRRIRTFCQGLATLTLRGHQRDDIRAGLRIVSFERRVVIAFIVDGDTVVIGRVFYGGRDYETLLNEEPGGF